MEQAIYTPRDGEREMPDPDDRPYAGVLVATAGLNVRDGTTLHTDELALGRVARAYRSRKLSRI